MLNNKKVKSSKDNRMYVAYVNLSKFDYKKTKNNLFNFKCQRVY